MRELQDTIDWTPYFASWELVGRYPQILKDPIVGEAASKLWTDTQELLNQLLAENLFQCRAVLGFWPANCDSDDIILWQDETAQKELARLHSLRQQMRKSGDGWNLALADFVAPTHIGKLDAIGAFCVTAGPEEYAMADQFKQKGDDYSAIMVSALADRFAESYAEYLHRQVRRSYWGYAASEQLTPSALIGEKYRGIRPAPGYPAQPDHTEKDTLFSLLDSKKNIGVTLTESRAMWPGASVSGLYFSHPDSHYFGVGRIGRDQVEDYARRKNWNIEKAEKWLAPILAYTA